MKVPFQFGKIVKGKYFTNRKKEIIRLKTNFFSYQSTILMSPRRWGKSSLVERAVQEMISENKDVKICHLNLFNIRSEDDFYSYFATMLLRATSNKIEELVKLGKELLGAARPEISVGVAEIAKVSVNFNLKEKEKDYLEILDLPERIALRKNIHLIVCIDEFQNIKHFKDPELFQDRIRSTWQNHQHVAYCIYGSKMHLLTKIFQQDNAPLYRFGDIIYLKKISSQDWLEFITKGFGRTGKKISGELAFKMTEIMGQHPYYVQNLAYITWNNTLKEVTEEILEESVREVLDQNSILFQEKIEELSNTQINFLKALAMGVKDGFFSQKILLEYELGTSANILKIKKALQEKDIVDFHADIPDFIDPVFKLWFIRRYLSD